MTKSMVTRTQEQRQEIDAKYNELCSALSAFDYQLREFTLLFDPCIKDIYERTQGVHDLLAEIDDEMIDEFGE